MKGSIKQKLEGIAERREEIDALVDALGEAAKVFGHGANGQ